MRALAIALFFCSALNPARGDTRIAVPFLSGPVVDEARLFDSDGTTRLTEALQRLNRSKKAQMVVYVPASLQDHAIEEFSIAVAEQWKLGKKGVDNGLLLIIAPKERRMRLEVGYGLEGVITDAYASRLLRERLAPEFQNGRYAEGVIATIDVIEKRLAGTATEQDLKGPAKEAGGKLPLGLPLLILLVVAITVFEGLFMGRRRMRGWGVGSHRSRYGQWPRGGGGFGGLGGFGRGGFGGGGGGFGGGGASGRW